MQTQKTSTRSRWRAFREWLGLKIAGLETMNVRCRRGAHHSFHVLRPTKDLRIDMPVGAEHGKVQFAKDVNLDTRDISKMIDQVTAAKSVQEEFPEFFPEQNK